MKHHFLRSSSLLFIGLAGFSLNALAYESSFERIQWDKRGNDTFYCIDITGVNYEIHPWLQALNCGENLYSFSPKDYLSKIMKRGDLMPGSRFGWRVWSPGGYGGNGYEGVVTVQNCVGQPYASSSANIQWSCRNNDTFYCIDILNTQDQFVKQAAVCNEGLHSFSPTSLNLGAGNYRWKVWSPSGYAGNGFEGSFSINATYNNSENEGNEGNETNDDGRTTTPVVTTPIVTTPIVTTPVITTPVVTTNSAGKTAYNQYCSSCHGTPNNISSASSAAKTRSAINSNKGGMGFLNFLSDQQLNDIAAYVRNPN